jgi:DNA-binding transcriptional MerR regulator
MTTRPRAKKQQLEKSSQAFRTISEVSGVLDVPQHVLRFWETKFKEIKPLKRGGGRRYYRPDDIEVLSIIRELLYQDGYTIKGVQRLFSESGIKSIKKLSQGAEHTKAPNINDENASTSKSVLSSSQRSDLEDVLKEIEALRARLNNI